MKFDFRVDISSALNRKLSAKLYENVVAEESERQVHQSASKTARYAPRKTGALANSFPASISQKSATMWEYGSELPYATIQEFMNRTKAGFVRKTVQEDRPAFIYTLQQALRKVGR
ncbi:hypothetical protein ACRW9N_13450 [Listeria aquatica]|uniref:hypothetical protein n=1 Tax=Listeria aquatica TaxID=1494960 RepID=UPI003EF13E47